MSKERAYFLLSPDSIDGDYVKNYHIFDGYYSTVTGWRITDKESRCGKVCTETVNVTSIVKNTDDEAFCATVIRKHFSGINVCGNCMATFFADDD